MANKKQALKYIRKTEKRMEQNRSARSYLKTLNKKALALSDEQDEAVRQETAREVVSAFDRAAQKGIIHPNKASRKKASLAQYI